MTDPESESTIIAEITAHVEAYLAECKRTSREPSRLECQSMLMESGGLFRDRDWTRADRDAISNVALKEIWQEKIRSG